MIQTFSITFIILQYIQLKIVWKNVKLTFFIFHTTITLDKRL